MDIVGTDRAALLAELKRRLGEGCVAFGEPPSADFHENIALCDEALLTQFLETGAVADSAVCSAIARRKVFPCYFGSALKLSGIDALLGGLARYTQTPAYRDTFGAKIFKIARDEQGNRLTYLKVTGGSLKVKELLSGGTGVAAWAEKVNQIRVYSGAKFQSVDEAEAGMVCAVTGLTHTHPGEGLGAELPSDIPRLEPVLTYRLALSMEHDARTALAELRLLEEEEPQLHVVWNEPLQEIQVQLMGEVQLEVLKRLIHERFGMEVRFGQGRIVYKETIADTVEGVGHFEPLRHYAEVHLLLAPGERGSG